MSDLRITAGPFEFRARWEREAAPNTCAAFAQRPIERASFFFTHSSTRASASSSEPATSSR